MTEIDKTATQKTSSFPKAPPPQVLTMTNAAANRICDLLSHDPQATALRLGVGTKGCSGHSYEISYTSDIKPWDEVIEHNGARVVIDAAALMFVLGTHMDYREDRLQSGFVFENPNETGRCGCGESFHIDPPSDG